MTMQPTTIRAAAHKWGSRVLCPLLAASPEC